MNGLAPDDVRRLVAKHSVAPKPAPALKHEPAPLYKKRHPASAFDFGPPRRPKVLSGVPASLKRRMAAKKVVEGMLT